MRTITPEPKPPLRPRALLDAEGPVELRGMVHNIRDMGGFSFVLLRTGRDIVQCVWDTARLGKLPCRESDSVRVTGRVVREPRAQMGFEIHLDGIAIVSRAAALPPVTLYKQNVNLSLDSHLAYRPVVLRHPLVRAVFRLQDGLCRGFREYLTRQDFIEIHSPKIVSAGAEGGANIFKLDYFDRRAFLAQSPQFYKQAMVPVFERVFEIGPVFRAEPHDTCRHLNEYTSMDFEMGFIDSFRDIMAMETAMLAYTFRLLREEYADVLEMLRITLPATDSVPEISFHEAKETIAREYGRPIRTYADLEPEEERLLGRWAAEHYGTPLVFVTHYPTAARPFYTMDDPADPSVTLSFDLLLGGLEITTGGQRIHDYKSQVDKMLRLGMNPDDFESYLMTHRYGAPPHGGLGLGLERLTAQLAGIDNVRYAALFPRDMHRLEP
ncbi:MAG: aspartate--tRNA(Asn) ligase [Christensenellales bacterium]|jgi:nondiscriminating aspartyl-tRNA synthetase